VALLLAFLHGLVALLLLVRRLAPAEVGSVFEASCEVTEGLEDSAMLKIALTFGMDALDEVVITIQDESGIDHWGRGLRPASRRRRQKRSSGVLGSSTSMPARRWSATGRPGPAPTLSSAVRTGTS
jgi:hypothetical protein